MAHGVGPAIECPVRRRGRDMLMLAVATALLLGSAADVPADPARAGAASDTVDWGEQQILASRVVHHLPGTLPDQPPSSADPMDMFLVVESGGRQLMVLDGDSLRPIRRLSLRGELRGEPGFSPDGRNAYVISEGGWVARLDLRNLAATVEVRAGFDTLDAAVSGDGRYLAVANERPHSLVIFDEQLRPVKVHEVRDRDGRRSSAVAAVRTARSRSSFVAVLRDIREIWELSYDPTAPDIPAGHIHDFQFREGAFVPGFLNPQRSLPDDYVADFLFLPGFHEILAIGRETGRGELLDLDVRRAISRPELPGRLRLGAGVTWIRQGRPVMAVPDAASGAIAVLGLDDWRPIRTIAGAAPGLRIAIHGNARHAWVDSSASRNHSDSLAVIDKETLAVVARIRPAPGRPVTQVEFSRDGRFVLASIPDEGTLVAFDAGTLRELRRIPAQRPVASYNLWNRVAAWSNGRRPAAITSSANEAWSIAQSHGGHEDE